jgi:hypothetical protein
MRGSNHTALSTWIAGAFLVLLLVFPQLPLQFRFAVVLSGFILSMGPSAIKTYEFKLIFAYTIYEIILGVAVVMFYDDGTVAESLYGLKNLAICSVVLVFSKSASKTAFLLLNSTVIVVSSFGLFLDVYAGPARDYVPFPIFRTEDLNMIEQMQLQGRFGGFTFEASVAGGLIAIFILLNLALIVRGFSNSKNRIGGRAIVFAIFAIAFSFIALAVCKTKSSLLILGAVGTIYSILSAFDKNVRYRMVAPALGGLLAIVILASSLVPSILKNSSFGEYITKEVDNITVLIERGFDINEGGGLETRLEYAKMALIALPFRPAGGGKTLGKFYATPALDYITINQEMANFFGSGRYGGYKGAIFSMMSEGGVVALIVLFSLFRSMFKSSMHSERRSGFAVEFALVVGLLALGVSVELLPYLAIVLYARIMMASGNSVIPNRSVASIRVGQPVHSRLIGHQPS